MTPFTSQSWTTFTVGRVDSVTSEIKSLESEYVLKASMAELEAYFVKKVIIEPLTLYTDDWKITNQSHTKIDVSRDFSRAIIPGEPHLVSGTAIDIAIPFKGDTRLWEIQPSTVMGSGYPEIDIRNNEIILSIRFADDSANREQLKSEINHKANSLKTAVESLTQDVNNHNNSAPQTVKQALVKKCELARSATDAVASLGIPLRRAKEKPTFSVPITRREKPIQKPKVETGEYKPEPILEEEEYQHILGILGSMSLVIERNPKSFSLLEEQTIRDLFLIQLNGHYKGDATGETFNAFGKTDILIRAENKNVFIAECKFWHGPKAFRDAVTQLLSYLTWRDSKAALLVFNKTKDSSSIRNKMHETMETLAEYRKTDRHDPNGDSRYILVKESEPGKEIIVTTQLYDIPENH